MVSRSLLTPYSLVSQVLFYEYKIHIIQSLDEDV